MFTSQQTVTGRVPGPVPLTREDLIFNRLPASAKAVMAELRSEKEDQRSLSMAASEKQSNAVQAKHLLERDLRAFTENPDVRRRPEAYDHQVLTLTNAVEKAKVEISRCNNIMEIRAARHGQIAHLLAAVEDHVGRIPPASAIVAFTGEAAKAPRGDLVDAVEVVRRKILERKSDVAAIEAAPIPSSVAKQLARQQIDALAARGAPNCFNLVESGQAIDWPIVQNNYHPGVISGLVRNDIVPPPNFMAGQVDAFALQVFLNRAAFIAVIEAKIDEAADDSHALSDSERTKRRVATLADLLLIEREEEALIRLARGKGLSELQRRVDADPRAVLGIV